VYYAQFLVPSDGHLGDFFVRISENRAPIGDEAQRPFCLEIGRLELKSMRTMTNDVPKSRITYRFMESLPFGVGSWVWISTPMANNVHGLIN
jgi:hypothetical protein